ncbi:MAG: D-alanyl-D-alanine carboxypeptidase/D-alanyl-D-alanine-endopeptidase [Ferruginibacter sp.]
MKILACVCLFLYSIPAFTQPITQQLTTAFSKLAADTQFSHATISMYVVESKTGKMVFSKNEQLGMAPASCQKIVTSISAFELLGKHYSYKTFIGHDGIIKDGRLIGNIIIAGSGDPTLGSWRWQQTKRELLFANILSAVNKKNISSIDGGVYINDLNFSLQPLPDGWIWQDIGNYYGAGAWGFNWNENQFDLNLKAGYKPGDQAEIISTSPVDLKNDFTNMITTGPKGSGDNAYIYAAPFGERLFATGTIPAGENKFTIAGSMPNPPLYFAKALGEYFNKNKMLTNTVADSYSNLFMNKGKAPLMMKIFDSIISPSLDSINYWFLKKSVNLYGEAFVKTIGYEKIKQGSTDSGMALIKNFWRGKGIDMASIKIIDGSGLSPANRITTKALVSMLQFARNQGWFESFYNALPVLNALHMKDGYINGVRSYTGYVKSSSGTEYSFSFIVNNFDGSPGTVREKMWRLLDILK